jgi:signal transduction histidine kinase
MLYEFIERNREDIIRRCRAKVAARTAPAPAEAELEHGVPLFLDQLAAALRLGLKASPEIASSASLHGHDLLRRGFTVSQVVHDYGDVCQSITDLAVETQAPVSTEDFRMLNGCLDAAIASAVTQYGHALNQSTIDVGIVRDNERLGFFVHELANLLHTATVAFEVVKSGNVGLHGSTGAVLQRSLSGACDLIARTTAEVRLANGIQHRQPFLVSEFIEELTAAATLTANAKAVALTVMPVGAGVAVDADRQILAAVLTNVLQNAFKFTQPRTMVTLRVDATADRVRIEVEDRCGGLPGGDPDALFRPFEQRSANRTGLGLGLAFSRSATEANDGRLYVRNLPGEGCVFVVDLPRCPMSVLAVV